MKQQFKLLMMIQFFIYFGFSIVIPVIPALVHSLNLNAFHMGLLLASYSIVSFIVAPMWGYLSDKYGRKKILIIGLIGFTLSFVLFGLFIDNLPMLYTSRILGGLFSGACFSTTTSMVSDMTTHEERNKYMGLMGMMIGLGFIFGPAVGGLLSGISYQIPYFVTAAILTVIALFCLFTIQETLQHSTDSEQATVNPKLLTPAVYMLLLSTFIVTFTMSGMESSFQLFEIEKINITATQMGMLFMIGGLVNAGLQGRYLRKVKHGQEKPVIITGQLITIVAFIMLPFSMNLFYAGLCLVLLMSGNALVRTLLTSQLTKETSSNKMGKLTSISYSMDSLGRILGPLLFTALLSRHLEMPFYFGALTSVFGLILLFIYYKKGRVV
ncbi:MFS transporter [Macrococcoides caseolyticum subsp. caseolyticum]|uniref:MFS transporter n=1 Tax=Macrococcoides caseolyticum TaxID=69966 RepID=UPI000CD2BA36|nr:MFS transporter [Macrococcus caseolyticus]PNZ71503.1 MFS transporter [Macrococcus caseolyticus]QPT46555.1 MFS transporter [Macrococcus caseolyticus]RAK45807.1 MFS transporter [Macrococcus caseolyticus subsp. caseolyticus]HCD19509.1 MFS transporter [Macrococcus caseolyticus]